jgi:hypothetical protein
VGVQQMLNPLQRGLLPQRELFGRGGWRLGFYAHEASLP